MHHCDLTQSEISVICEKIKGNKDICLFSQKELKALYSPIRFVELERYDNLIQQTFLHYAVQQSSTNVALKIIEHSPQLLNVPEKVKMVFEGFDQDEMDTQELAREEFEQTYVRCLHGRFWSRSNYQQWFQNNITDAHTNSYFCASELHAMIPVLYTPLHYAAEIGAMPIFSFLNSKKEIEKNLKDYESACSIALIRNHLTLFSSLAEAGVQLNPLIVYSVKSDLMGSVLDDNQKWSAWGNKQKLMLNKTIIVSERLAVEENKKLFNEILGVFHASQRNSLALSLSSIVLLEKLKEKLSFINPFAAIFSLPSIFERTVLSRFFGSMLACFYRGEESVTSKYINSAIKLILDFSSETCAQDTLEAETISVLHSKVEKRPCSVYASPRQIGHVMSVILDYVPNIFNRSEIRHKKIVNWAYQCEINSNVIQRIIDHRVSEPQRIGPRFPQAPSTPDRAPQQRTNGALRRSLFKD